MNDRFFPASKPRAVQGGIKARSTRGAIAQTWWSGRFIAVLEDMGLGGRLQRGRRYARTGQVIDLVVAAGLVSAQVQGSRVKPYRVRISIDAASDLTSSLGASPRTFARRCTDLVSLRMRIQWLAATA